MFFSVTTKNLNWEILTKILVTFKRWDEIKDEEFKFYGDSVKNAMKNLIFRGGHEKPICRGYCLKMGD